MLDAKKWMYILLNLKVEFENLTTAYEKLNRECKLKWQTQNVGYIMQSTM